MSNKELGLMMAQNPHVAPLMTLATLAHLDSRHSNTSFADLFVPRVFWYEVGVLRGLAPGTTCAVAQAVPMVMEYVLDRGYAWLLCKDGTYSSVSKACSDLKLTVDEVVSQVIKRDIGLYAGDVNS
jgi:hypothetical protein